MALPSPNQLLSYDFSEDEIIVAPVFTELQTQYLQSMLVLEIQTKNNFSYNPGEGEAAKDNYIFGQEYHRGRVEILQHLLDTSEDYKEKQRELHRRQATSQQEDS